MWRQTRLLSSSLFFPLPTSPISSLQIPPMAEASTALCFSSFSPSFSRPNHPSLSRAFPRNFPVSHPCPSRLLRFPAKSSSSDSLPDDLFGFFPWSNDSEIQWVPEDRVTLFTSEGLVQIGGSMVPRRVASSDKKRSKASQRYQRFQESDYMDTEQGLCLGALFDIAATNGLDMGRRLCIYGQIIQQHLTSKRHSILAPLTSKSQEGGKKCHVSEATIGPPFLASLASDLTLHLTFYLKPKELCD